MILQRSVCKVPNDSAVKLNVIMLNVAAPRRSIRIFVSGQFKQGTLTVGEGSVQLTSSLR
jgi:hypothetical protein